MKRRAWWIGAILVVLAAVLFVPSPDPAPPRPAAGEAFAWDADALWRRLETDFDRARTRGCAAIAPILEDDFARFDAELARLQASPHPSDDPIFARLEEMIFATSARVGACPDRTRAWVERVRTARDATKAQSERWDAEDARTRRTLYRVLYGSRAAIEELLLQDRAGVPALVLGVDEPSRTPSVELHGVRLHSGDILLSRGGAPTSALIARGNDYPGNFSHVALLHVSEAGVPTLIESHIESGLGLSSAERYLADTKLRIEVLRVRADHPAILADPMIPHRAAEDARRRAQGGHVAYDFAMDIEDPASLFCSEVASSAYAAHGVRLWQGLSTMSGEGLTRWLGAFGVEHFETFAPSDLEYDPQVVVVAEWRDPQALFEDHVDNAVVDGLLEGAERGEPTTYAYLRLPLARLAKAYSVVLNAFGAVGPIPEGMSATTALRVEWLRERHAAIRAQVIRRADDYRRRRGRRPPYWELVQMARDAIGESARR